MEKSTLDEAIYRVKGIAKKQRWNSKYVKVSLMNEELNKRHESDCIKDAEKHDQLAEWLEELKSYRDIGTLKELKELKENGAFTGLELAKLAIMQKELKEYKDLEEQGLLVRLPFKLGTALFRINKGARKPIIKMKVLQITVASKSYSVKAIEEDYGEVFFSGDAIGLKVFLTREEAVKKLEELKNEI